jgi:NADH-quinone oxidoreductase subunit C
VLPEALADNPVVVALSKAAPSAILDSKLALDELTLIVDPGQLAAVCSFLKQQLGFDRLSSVTAVDWWPRQPRFEVVYHVNSVARKAWLRLKVRVGEGAELDSVTSVWRAANWYEREVFDLFGVGFRNHPNLERILMPADWEGHPMRKDFPIHGYRYSYRDA